MQQDKLNVMIQTCRTLFDSETTQRLEKVGKAFDEVMTSILMNEEADQQIQEAVTLHMLTIINNIMASDEFKAILSYLEKEVKTIRKQYLKKVKGKQVH